jgi:hypothetical protein
MKPRPASCAPAARLRAHGWTSRRRKPDAWLAAERGGRWCYIRVDDLDTLNNFTLLKAIFASIVDEAPCAKPLLVNKRRRVTPLLI